MPTIIEQSAGALYKQPQRTVATFPSGLVRIDQAYMCSNSAESTHRATLAVGNELPDDDGHPAIDGAFIFPHCQQVRNGSGFTEFVASAYGRTTDQPTNFISTAVTVPGDQSSYRILNVTCEIVLPTEQIVTLEALNLDSNIFEPFDFFFLNSFNTVKFVEVVENKNFTLTGLSADAIERPFNNRRRILAVTFDLFTSTGDPTGQIFRAIFRLNDPTIKIISQSHFGKFTEYKIGVDHNITTGPTSGEAGQFATF